ncbi:MAG: mechanosensitive ion channel family protein [Acidimicrobiales bacterium]
MLLSAMSVVGGVAAQVSVEAQTRACGAAEQASSVCLSVLRATGNEVLAESSEALIVRPSKVLIILLVAWIARRLAGRVIARVVTGVHDRTEIEGAKPAPSLRRVKRAETIAALLRSVSSLTIWTVAIFMALGELGFNLGPLIAGAGIVGVAIGFGSQNLVRDFVSGIFMLIEDQFGVGDTIDAGEATGVVESVSLRTTRLRDVHGTVWHVPNGQIDRVGNKSQHWSRAVIDVGVAYDTDLARATQVMKGAAESLCADAEFADLILDAPEVWGVEDLGADGVTIRLALKTLPSQQDPVERELRARLKGALDEAGIEIPFQQRTVWHRVGDPELGVRATQAGAVLAMAGPDRGADARDGKGGSLPAD